MSSPEAAIRAYYHALFQAWGAQDWWPARSRFEVIVGAYLTQNTNWINVEHALRNLRRAGVLNIAGIRNTPLPELEKMVRPAGYFRQKARRLKTFVEFLDGRYEGSLMRMFARPTTGLRQELLALTGIGPETADSILLYAGGHPVFVVDAYTRRIMERHRIVSKNVGYEDMRRFFENALAKTAGTWGVREMLRPGPLSSIPPRSAMSARRRHKYVLPKAPPLARVFDECHALIVMVGKHYCLKNEAHCQGCPLERFLPKKNFE